MAGLTRLTTKEQPSLYYKGNYPALQAVKAQWDPLNVFNHAQSVTAAT